MTGVRAGWRSSTEAPGALCVMTAGTPTMPTWSAGSWNVAGPFQPQEMPSMGRAQGPLSWTKWAAQGTRHTYGAAPTTPGTHTTANTARTPASSAQVGLKQAGDASLHVVSCLVSDPLGKHSLRFPFP